jgi:hypothetical protein
MLALAVAAVVAVTMTLAGGGGGHGVFSVAFLKNSNVFVASQSRMCGSIIQKGDLDTRRNRLIFNKKVSTEMYIIL